MGHQDPEDEEVNNHDIHPVHQPHSTILAPIQANPINGIASSGHLLTLPSSLCDPIDMESASVLIVGLQMLVSKL